MAVAFSDSIVLSLLLLALRFFRALGLERSPLHEVTTYILYYGGLEPKPLSLIRRQ